MGQVFTRWNNNTHKHTHTHVNPDALVHTDTREEDRALTSDQLGTLHNVSVRMVDGDFKSCNTREGLINQSSFGLLLTGFRRNAIR